MTFVLIFRQSSPAEAGPQNQLEGEEEDEAGDGQQEEDGDVQHGEDEPGDAQFGTHDVSSFVGSQETGMVSL